MDARNYSYNGRIQPKDGEYKAEGAAANPLTSQIGRFSFFRIEGHLGKNVVTVVAAIESEIKSKNLPFTVCSILLGLDKTKVVKKPGIRYSDLHRFHYLLRQDTHHQLNEVERFSGKFKLQVDQNVAGESNAIALRRDAEQRNTVVTENAKKVADKFKLHQNYAAYAGDLSWKSELKDTVRAASEFKFNIGDVVKTEFTTPFDTLIGSTHFQWLDWMEQIIKKKDDSEDEKLLFVNFISQNPGMEHFAGVLRGGTFILVHDNNNTVVADFMLPYYLEDKIEPLPNEPPLTKPDIRPEEIIDRGIRVIPSVDKRLFDFRGVLEPKITKKFDVQQKYFDIYKGFVDSSTGIFTAVGNIKPQKFTDPILDVQIREVELEQEKIRLLRQREQKEQTVRAETELAQSLVAIADYIAKAGISVTAGSDGAKAMQIVSDSVGSLNREKIALDTFRRGLEGVIRNNENNRELAAIIQSILRSLG
jgi:hypothetical protein